MGRFILGAVLGFVAGCACTWFVMSENEGAVNLDSLPIEGHH